MPPDAYTEGSWVEPVSRRCYGYRLWHPDHARALLVIVHGFGEHGGRYHSFAQALADQGIAVAVPDLWAHGRSNGPRGDLNVVTECAAQLVAMTQEVFLPQSEQSTYAVFGHSFGGLAAILWALNHPGALRRLMVQSPLLEVGFPIPTWKTTAARIFEKYWPDFSFAMQLDVTGLSHDPAVVAAYRNDPLVHHRMSARTYGSILRARDEIMERTPTLRVPVLLLCGSQDRIISLEAARRWFDLVLSEKQVVVFPGSYHELHHETVRAEVLQRVAAWTLQG